MSQPPGRRERKKAQTRQALADTALELFIERGYDNVGVREIADSVDVSTTTLFKYFPSKEALFFDADEEVEEVLLDAVRDRGPEQSITDALLGYARRRVETLTTDARARPWQELVSSTPALQDYARRMWLRHENALAALVAAEIGAPADDPECAALAHFALESVDLAVQRAEPLAALEAIFRLIERGWAADRGERG